MTKKKVENETIAKGMVISDGDFSGLIENIPGIELHLPVNTKTVLNGTGICSTDLRRMTEFFGPGFTLLDVKVWYKQNGYEFSDATFPEIVRLVDSKSKDPDDPAAVWSKPMSKSRMMAALGIDSEHTFNMYAKRIGIHSDSRKLHRIRLDKMDSKDKEKIEKA